MVISISGNALSKFENKRKKPNLYVNLLLFYLKLKSYHLNDKREDNSKINIKQPITKYPTISEINNAVLKTPIILFTG